VHTRAAVIAQTMIVFMSFTPCSIHGRFSARGLQFIDERVYQKGVTEV
jgi:hypothetical protein